MDCDRFEATLIDELYEELDELTSAAAKRHVAGCSRCASLIGGLRATRRVAVLPIVEPSVDLEDRILAAARDAQRVVPFGRRISLAISWAGSWAMRPQTAMAAVFLLMVGSSLLFVRRSKVAAIDSSVTVTAQGRPAPAQASAAPAEDLPSVDSKIAAAAHGAGPTPTPAAAAPPVATVAASASAYASGQLDEIATKETSAERGRALPKASLGANSGFGGGGSDLFGPSSNAAAPAGAPVARYAQRPAGPVLKGGGKDDGLLPSDLDKAATSGGAQAQADTARQAWDPAVSLQQAHATRDASGCAAAVGTFDQIALQAAGTRPGYQAKYDAAECYRQLGQYDEAQRRYGELTTVPSFIDLAKTGIARVQSQRAAEAQSQVATRKKAAAPAKPAAIAPTQQNVTTPQAAPAAPPAQNAPADQAPAQLQRAY